VVPALLPLREEARAFKAQAFAPSTKLSYRTHLMAFVRFCMYYDLTPVPATQETLSCYVAHLARTMSPNSISIYLNIIRIMHEEAGLKNPLEDNFEIMMIKRGVKRVKGVPPKQKAPVTVEILIDLFRGMDLSRNSEKAFHCALLVGFFGFLRKASLFPALPDVPVLKRLSRQDVVRLCLDSFELHCYHSKTIQFGQQVHTIPFFACTDLRICPIFAMMTHLGASSGLSPTSSLFNYVEGGVEKFYSHAAFVARLKVGIKRSGRDPREVSCHSLRRGGATLSFACGISCDQIKLRGDWASDCYQRYLFVPPSATMEVARIICQGAAARSVSLI
jgi:hypothetical protein